MKTNKEMRRAKLERRAKNYQPKQKRIPAKKTSPTPKAPRREKCGCEKHWNVEKGKYEGHVMCHAHAEQLARIIKKTAENLAKKKEAKK